MRTAKITRFFKLFRKSSNFLKDSKSYHTDKKLQFLQPSSKFLKKHLYYIAAEKRSNMSQRKNI